MFIRVKSTNSETKHSLLEPVVKSLYKGDQEFKYRSYQRHQLEFYLAVLQFNLESSYRWNPHCASPSEFAEQSECFDGKFKNMPTEMKCTKLNADEYWKKCENKPRCVQCHYSKDINSDLTMADDEIVNFQEECLDFSGDNDEKLVIDCPLEQRSTEGHGFCFNEVAVEWKIGEFNIFFHIINRRIIQ